MEEQELDPYEKQLLAEFESCDQDCKGSLDCNGLQHLCEKLQLDDHGQEFMEYILGSKFTNPNKRITFHEFRDGLLAFLGGSQNEVQITKEISGRGSPDREVSPKFVFGKKKYGRRSRPESSEFDDQDDVFEDSDLELVVSIDGEHKEIFMRPRCEQNEENFFQEKVLSSENKSSVERNLPMYPDQGQVVNGGSQQSPTYLRQNEEEGLRAAWERLGVGQDGFLHREELVLVCQAVGMEKVAEEIVRQLFEKLNVDSNGRISFEEFLLLLRGGESWPHTIVNSEAVSTPSNSSKIQQYQEHSNGPKRESLSATVEKDSRFLDLSIISADAIVEMWETAQVPGASRLLQDLGFSYANQVNVSELAMVLDEELRHLSTERRNEGLASLCSPQEMLLQATLCLYQAEVRCLKSSVEHISAERDKLRADILDANERASLLAQEVDDHHARLEESSQLQVKMLEQRHALLTKELTEQLTIEREQLALQNATLEQQLTHLQEEEARLHAELAVARSENESLERENQSLLEQLHNTRSELQKHVESLEGMQQWVSELEGRQEQEQVLPLLEKVRHLEAENVELRDQCDELTMKCETLAARLVNNKTKKSVIMQTSCDGDPAEESSGGGTKRRGGSPAELRTSAAVEDVEGANPRIGKIRRCCNENAGVELVSAPGIAGLQLKSPCDGSDVEAGLTMEEVHQQSSTVTDISTIEKGNDASEVERLHFRISFLEKELARMNSTPVIHKKEAPCLTSFKGKTNNLEPSTQIVKVQLKQVFEIIRQQVLREVQEDNNFINSLPQSDQRPHCGQTVHKICNEVSCNAKDIKTLERHCDDLKFDLDQVKAEIVKILSEKNVCSKENCALKNCISDLGNKLHINVATVENERRSLGLGSECNGDNDSLEVVLENVKCIHGCPQTVIISNDSNGGEGADTLDGLVQVPGNETKSDNDLVDRCQALERSLELLRLEYEKCEDYWAGKLEEERKLYEQEQAVSDEKFAELLGKIREYEEMYGEQDDHSEDSDDRLSTIEERASLEKQVTDLEEECEELRLKAEQEHARRGEELARLRQQLQLLEQQKRTDSTRDVSVQVSDLENCSWESNCTFVVELDSARKSSPNAKDGGSVHRTKDTTHDFSNGYGSSSSCEGDLQHLHELREQLNEECHALLKKKDMLAHELMLVEHNNISYALKGPKTRGQACQIDLSVLQALNSRLRHQEQQYRQLQASLKKQQQHSDTLLKRTWQQHEEEVIGLRAVLQNTQEKLREETQKLMERLMQADVLVRDLYVENAYLAANVQRLEQRCQVFVQLSADSSSV